MDQSWLIPGLIWLMVGLSAVAIALGVMVFSARRLGVNGNGAPSHVKPRPSGPANDDKPAHRPGHKPASHPNAKPGPLKLSLRDFRGLRLADFRNDGRALRDFGELVTVATLAAEGWKKLPSGIQGGQGLDLLVVREVRGAGGFEARAIEVKTNNASYSPTTMSDERVQSALGHLHDIGAFDEATFGELYRGVVQGPPYFRKELWRHQLDSGVTTIWDLDEAGGKTTSQLRSSAHLMDALFQMIKQLDRNADYVDRPPVETTQAEEISLVGSRGSKRTESFMGSYSRAFAFRPKRRA